MAAVGTAVGRGRWSRLVAAGRPLHAGPVAWAGHNRWSKVRNVKGPRDAARSRLFQRLGAMLRVAAREGGPDPALNAQLANVVEQCRAKNMPKASIEAAVRGATGPGPGPGPARLLYEARGPGGSALLLEVLTDNPRRSQAALRLLLARHGATMAEGARHSFERKGVVRVGPRDRRGRPVSLEAALEAALRAGAHDVCQDGDEPEEEEPLLKFICEASALRDVREQLEAAGLRPLSAAIEYLPRDTVQLSEAALEQAARLLDALGDCPDVVRVYDNIQ
ncbi:translational activator of cytochrome c oxidase 1 isoform X4 [Struthio camelus]